MYVHAHTSARARSLSVVVLYFYVLEDFSVRWAGHGGQTTENSTGVAKIIHMILKMPLEPITQPT